MLDFERRKNTSCHDAQTRRCCTHAHMNFWFEREAKEAHFRFRGSSFDAMISSRLHATTVVDEEEGIENRRRMNIGGRRAHPRASLPKIYRLNTQRTKVKGFAFYRCELCYHLVIKTETKWFLQSQTTSIFPVTPE
jgi:hypothetical protein